MFVQQSRHRTRDAALLAAALVTSASPALGQQVANATTDRAAYLAEKCDHLFKDPPRHVGCYAQEALNFERARGAAADRRGAEAEKSAIKKEEASRCVMFLTEGVKAGRFDKAEILEKAGGKLSADNACPVAIKYYNYQRKAEATVPAVK